MRIIHLSDIHLEKVYETQTSRLVANLIECLQEESREKLIDFIVISGDLVDKGGHSYGSTKEALERFEEVVIAKILEELNLDRTHVIICPGNHDIEDKDEFKVVEESLKGKEFSQALISDIYYRDLQGKSDTGKKYKDRLKAFDVYHQTFIDKSESQTGCLESSVKFDCEGHRVGFSSLNSVWLCKEHGVGNPFVLGYPQINEVKDFLKDCDLKIAVMHNHPNQLTPFESNDVDKLLSKVFNVLLLGHSHSGKEAGYIDPSGESYYYVQSPGIIAYNGGQDHAYKNGFRILDFDFESGDLEVKAFNALASEKFVQDRNYAEKGVWQPHFKDYESLLPVAKSLLKQVNHGTTFIPAQIFDNIIETLKSGTNDTMLVALPGLGKTRLLYEAFNPRNGYGMADKTFYCYLSGKNNLENIKKQIELKILQGNKGITIILDNCDFEVFNSVVKMRNELGGEIRVIGISNNVYDTNSHGIQTLHIPLTETKKAIDEYVDSKIDDSGDNLIKKIHIKKIADGFPMLANALVEKALSDQAINLNDAKAIVNSLVDSYRYNLEEEEKKLLMTIALFQPFPLEYDARKQLLKLNCLSELSSLPELQLTRVFKGLKRKLEGTLLDVTDVGWNVRPYPLALYLASDWFENYGDEDTFKGLIEEIDALPNPPRNLIIECMARRIEKMDGCLAAQKLVAKLMSHGSVFNSEKVVNSELGSRLLLAMSTVNPPAVAKCIHDVTSSQTSQWFSSIGYEERRHIVSALSKLVSDKESYPDAIATIARFADIPTEEYYGNESLDLFKQSFRSQLPGTEASLKERAQYLKDAVENGELSDELIVIALSGAYSFGSAVRFGGNEFGPNTKRDYQINDWNELREYWEVCNVIALKLIEGNKCIEDITSIVKTNFFRWASNGLLIFLKPLLEEIFKRNGTDLQIDECDFDNIMAMYQGNDLADTFKWLSEMKPYLISNSFSSRLANANKEMYLKRIPMDEHWLERTEEHFMPLVDAFLSEKIYLNKGELQDVMKENEGYSMSFVPALVKNISEGEVCEMQDSIKAILTENASILETPFIAYLLPNLNRRFDITGFLSCIKEASEDSYIGLMARCEDHNLSMLNRLECEYGEDRISRFLPIYLYRCNRYLGEPTIKLLDFLNEHFEKAPEDIMRFCMRSFSHLTSEDDLLTQKLTYIATKYDPKEVTSTQLDDYLGFVVSLLENRYDVVVAKSILRKIIVTTNPLSTISHGRESFFQFMMSKHADDIIDDILDALFDENPSFFSTVRFELGSGFGFGVGPLFGVEDAKIRRKISECPELAAPRIATMCPVFGKRKDDGSMEFSDWVIYLTDNYPTNDVLDAIGCNVDSYQWSGTIIPLLEDKKSAFYLLLEHKKSIVRNWATKYMDQLEHELKVAKDAEDFMRQHYGD